EERGKIEGNTVLLLGDLKYGRTVHSLAYALTQFGADLICVSPKGLEMPKEVVKRVSSAGGKIRETTKLAEHLTEADVLYVTRIQKERFPDPEEYRKMVGTYRVDLDLLKDAKRDLIVMHPLPRVDEVAPEVDGSPHARYFQQAFNAVPVRMAILSLILGGDK
ncbi:MAG TPA: aspartate carbamoyltransferase, partial [Thermoplasmata archaeon]|nr:aspartate carbamoyltransferase [Thermoplasmata archaeon]